MCEVTDGERRKNWAMRARAWKSARDYSQMNVAVMTLTLHVLECPQHERLPCFQHVRGLGVDILEIFNEAVVVRHNVKVVGLKVDIDL
jgi:hypothetical protein